MTDEIIAVPFDYLRVITLIVLALVVILSAVVVGLYLRRWASQVVDGGRTYLPAHVWAIALSYLVFVIAAAAEVVPRLGTTPTYRSIVYIFAGLIGIGALASLFAHEVTEARAHRQPR